MVMCRLKLLVICAHDRLLLHHRSRHCHVIGALVVWAAMALQYRLTAL